MLYWLLLLAPQLLTAQADSLVAFPYVIQKEVLAESGIVVAAHPLAARVGAEILRQGGNAADAAAVFCSARCWVCSRGGYRRIPADTGFHSAAAVHVMAEVARRAFADRAAHLGDPDAYPVPVDTLMSSAYLAVRMADFNPDKATPSKGVAAGKISEQTTHISIVDAEGNAAAVTTTLNDAYGSRLVIPGAGFIMNNEMDDFSAKPGTPNLYGAIGGKANAIAPGKRPLSSMSPTIITQNGKLSLVLGTPGGTTIPSTVFQIILNTYHFKLPLPEAVRAARFHHQWSPDQIFIEEGGLPESVIQQLTNMGHTVAPRGPIGRVEAVLIRPDGKRQGVADVRGDDAAAQ